MKEEITINTNSTTSGTTTFQEVYPLAQFQLPRFKCIKESAPIYFYTIKEIDDFFNSFRYKGEHKYDGLMKFLIKYKKDEDAKAL